MATPDPAPRRPSKASHVWRTALIIVAILVALGVIAVVTINWWGASPHPPGAGTKVVASDLSKAEEAFASAPSGTPESDAANWLRTQPTAYWLTPEADPLGEVTARIEHLASEAREQSATLAIVVYGLPGRDCGNFSAGGLEPAAYAEWTAAIGDALRAAALPQVIVILEPDSLALAPECGNLDERVVQLSAAVDDFIDERIWVYLDGGHSNWLPAEQMASIISQVGVLDRIRGVATNVSNYNDTASEVAYAHELADLLDGVHTVIDTSRNGAGSDGEWCNPTGRLVGDPGGTHGDDVVDTNIWIKPPGESDGTCNGGPEAGDWWPDAAVSLTEQARG